MVLEDSFLMGCNNTARKPIAAKHLRFRKTDKRLSAPTKRTQGVMGDNKVFSPYPPALFIGHPSAYNLAEERNPRKKETFMQIKIQGSRKCQ
ncbi:unnamed protein product [Pieris brassicae]|uniref:Uncharacterized protein n=1 Tax=Pieris brassicae TaxID=7116 RepID=A0A9P0XJF2_PIEBR|nr:unnamed protein product [Pieris brassicae]